MGITLGDAILWLRADKSKLNSDLKSAETQTKGWVSSLGGIVKAGLGVFVGNVITSGVNAVAGSFDALKRGMIDGNAAFEDYNTRFKTLLGSAELAKDRMADLAEFGAKTPFELPDVVEADLVLQGFGLHAEEAAKKFGFAGEEIRTIAGDVASGTGASFKEVALLIGKFSSGATGEAIARFQEMGIATREQLSGMGLEFSKSGELLSPLPIAMETVLGLMKEKYGGLMEAQSTTFNGIMSNLQDWAAGTLRIIGQPIFELVRDKLLDLVNFLSSEQVKGFIDEFAFRIEMAVGVIRYGFDNVVIPALQRFGNWFFDGGGSSGVIGFVTWIGNVALPTLVRWGDWFLNAPNGGLATFIGFINSVVQPGLASLQTFLNDIIAGFQSGGLEGAVNAALAGLKPALDGLIETVSNFFAESWPKIQEKLTEWSARFWDWVLGPQGALIRTNEVMSNINKRVQEWIAANKDKLTTLGRDLATNMLDGLKLALQNQEKMNQLIAELVASLGRAIIFSSKIISEAGTSIGSGMVEGIIKYFGGGEVSERMKGVISGVVRGALTAVVPAAQLGDVAKALGIPGFATGGIVPGALGQPTLAIVHGGEEIRTPEQQRQESPLFALIEALQNLASEMRNNQGTADNRQYSITYTDRNPSSGIMDVRTLEAMR